eukprot:11358312-Heterocapsa_arctica.AAC.1
MPGWATLAVPALPAWPRLRFERPFPVASEGMPGFRNPCGHPLAAGACAELSKSCGHVMLSPPIARTVLNWSKSYDAWPGWPNPALVGAS